MLTTIIHISRVPMLSLLMVWMGFFSMETGEKAVEASAPQKVAALDMPVQALYQKDAARLALRALAGSGGYGDLGPEIPAETQGELYQALVAVHESPLPEAKEVTRIHKLHTFPDPVVDMFQVNYKKTAAWAKPLQLGDLSTDNPTINRLCEQYGLVMDSQQNWDEETGMFVVKAKAPMNMAPVAASFQDVEGVVLTRLPMPSSDGNDIEAFKTAKGWHLDYKVKFGGCFTGCQQEHVWSFEVSNLRDGFAIVDFKGETGDELPDWMQ